MRNGHSTECLDIHNGFLEMGDFYGFISKLFSIFWLSHMGFQKAHEFLWFLTQDFLHQISGVGSDGKLLCVKVFTM